MTVPLDEIYIACFLGLLSASVSELSVIYLLAGYWMQISSVERPLVIPGARRVLPMSGAKRPRPEELEAAVASSSAAAKKHRSGNPAQQWITTYNKFPPMKQRYHCNVTTARLLTHVEKGWDDGLFISSVCSSAGTWAVVMDASTGFSSQIYRVSHWGHKNRSSRGVEGSLAYWGIPSSRL